MQLYKEVRFSCGSIELLHDGLQLELKWLSLVELIEELMELCSV